MRLPRSPRPEWAPEQALHDTAAVRNYFSALKPEYDSVAQWDPSFDPDGPTFLVPDEWLPVPLCNVRWRPAPPIEEFNELFQLKRDEREARRQEIVEQNGGTFRISYAFCPIVTRALEQLNRPQPLSKLIISGRIVDYAVQMAHILVLNQKMIYKRARPVQYFPELDPFIWPAHSSFPSGHSTEAHTAAYLLDEAMRLPRDPLCGLRNELASNAWRIAHNREIAGVHFPSDTIAGQDLARRLVDHLIQSKSFAQEFADLRACFA